MHALMYEGHKLIYDLGRNLLEWVPIRGMSSSLTLVELRSANDLNNICPYPHSKWEFTKAHSPQLVYGRPVGEETDTNSWNEPSDSEEWDEPPGSADLPHLVACYGHALRDAHGVSSCPFDGHDLLRVLYFFHNFVMTFVLIMLFVPSVMVPLIGPLQRCTAPCSR